MTISWLWGGNRRSVPPQITSFNDLVPPAKESSAGDAGSEKHKFDSSALERAAEAAKYLENSRKY